MDKTVVAKAVTDKLCEIMDSQGYACDPDCGCWKQGTCDFAKGLEQAVLDAFDRS